MRVTEKGQVTIPKDIRDRLRIEAGSEVEFIERADGAVELVRTSDDSMREQALHRSLDEWFRQIEGTGDSGLSSDEIMSLTRGHDGDDNH